MGVEETEEGVEGEEELAVVVGEEAEEPPKNFVSHISSDKQAKDCSRVSIEIGERP